MANSSDTENRRAALHAYTHAREAGRGVRHKVDVVDEPMLDYGAPRPRPIFFPSRWLPPPTRPVESVDHAFAEPGTTAFKVGFGFSAGAAVFQLAAVVGLTVVLGLIGIIAYASLD